MRSRGRRFGRTERVRRRGRAEGSPPAQLSWVEHGPRARPVVQLRRTDPPPIRPAPAPTAPAPRGGHGPILPFLGVLLRGRDAPLFAPVERVPPYHPSVGYARDIYVAIAMNGLVDLVGFTVLFRAYLAGRAPGWPGWALAGALGAAFSVAFGTFAVGLVRKPLRRPRFDRRALTGAGVIGAAGLAAVGFGAPGVGAGAIGVAIAAATCSALGPHDGALLFTRGLVMTAVAWLVAGPLHEAMFHDEIDRAFRAAGLAAVDDEIARRTAALDGARAAAFERCMRAGGQPPDPTCAAPKAEAERAELWVQALAFVRGQELTGADAAHNRALLLDRAEAIGASAVVALLGAGATGRAGHGPRYREAVAMAPEADRTARAAGEAVEACVATAAECEAEVERAPEVASIRARLGDLRARAEALRSGAARPGPIERALALEALASGTLPGGADDAAPVGIAIGERRGAAIRQKLFAAWFLAAVMPLVVLIMKIGAADKLEPYLRRRWAGR